jgi:hypothetical protein
MEHIYTVNCNLNKVYFIGITGTISFVLITVNAFPSFLLFCSSILMSASRACDFFKYLCPQRCDYCYRTVKNSHIEILQIFDPN